jgi:hypothetical protein
MKKIRICLILILLPLLLLTVTSCKIDEYEDMKHIYYPDILSQKEDEYYVYIYRYDCAVCERIKEDVIYYYKNYKKHDLPRLYVLNKGDTVNNQGINAESDDPVNFVWTYNYFDIKTPTSPYLIRVRKGQVIAAYDARSQILERLKIEE